MIFTFLSAFQSLWFCHFSLLPPHSGISKLKGKQGGLRVGGKERATGRFRFWGVSSSGCEDGACPNGLPPGRIKSWGVERGSGCWNGPRYLPLLVNPPALETQGPSHSGIPPSFCFPLSAYGEGNSPFFQKFLTSVGSEMGLKHIVFIHLLVTWTSYNSWRPPLSCT